MTTTINQIALNEALFAFLTERSAQMGEGLTREMFDEGKRLDPIRHSEEIAQITCAISAYGRAFPPTGNGKV